MKYVIVHLLAGRPWKQRKQDMPAEILHTVFYARQYLTDYLSRCQIARERCCTINVFQHPGEAEAWIDMDVDQYVGSAVALQLRYQETFATRQVGESSMGSASSDSVSHAHTQ